MGKLLLYAFLVLVPISSLMRGGILDTFWTWFIMSEFTNAPDLTFWSALGLSVIVTYLTYDLSVGDEKTKEKKPFEVGAEMTVKIIGFHLAFFIFGAIVYGLGS